MPNRCARTLLAACIPALVLLAACSSKGSSIGDSSSASVDAPGTTSAGGSNSAAAPAAATTFKLTTTAGHTYTVTITPKRASTTAPCSATADSGKATVPFTLTIHNESAAEVPQPWLGLGFTDPNAKQEVAAMQVAGTCIDFTLKGTTIPPSGTSTYEGSVSNATQATRLTVRLNDVPASAMATQAVALFAG